MEKVDPPIDSGIEDPNAIEYEIEILIRRLIETNPDAIYRIEKLVHRIKIMCIVEKRFH